MQVVIQADRDAKRGEEFSFVIHPKDVGDRKSPETCIFARCAKTHARAEYAWFGLNVAYLALPNKDGNIEIVRFRYPKATWRAIKQFDETGEVEPGVFKLIAPSPALTASGRRRWEDKNRSKVRKAKNEKGRKKATRIWHAPRGWGRGFESLSK